ncbi:scavenger receptor cysteine-rich domain superfamily protein-like isoform X2 [Asterias rubens]|uniref:scavenger receptor cysteine-rich domain superfamily protein-like isoform X2 n=1 Tax=Asterias rubens TaxID=7604 RepID=UPI0014559320|nr:scavenger receptor cysteine-rich domain superfamily protein-like isoform X2 [Asterias rubens]
MRMGVSIGPLSLVLQFILLSVVSAQSEYDLRLVDGSTNDEGRIEIFYQGSWGTICKTRFKIEEGQVACRQLGYLNAEKLENFRGGSGQIVMKNVNCNGNENKLFDCYRELTGRYCDHDDDVGVVCSNVQTTEAPISIDPDFLYVLDVGKLRLVGGPNPYEGRVEVNLLDIKGWATICSEFWDFNKAELACKHLGYRPATSTGISRYGAGTGPMAKCPVSRSKLQTFSCEIINATDPSSTCTHNTDVDIVCSGTEEGEQNAVRLVMGSVETEGRVEYYDQNAWKGLCSDDWGIEEAQATCRQLGLPEPSSNTVPLGGIYGGNEVILQNSYTCTGQERTLMNCTWTSRLTVCTMGDASVQCGTRPPAQEFDLRLVDGNTLTDGRVQILYQGEWGTICSMLFYIGEATAVCNMLGFQFASSSRSYRRGNGTVVVEYLNCNGNEESMLDCYHVVGTGKCSSEDDAGVVCSNLPQVNIRSSYGPFADDLRLVGGPNPYEGRVEIYKSDVIGWASICEENWDFQEAEVVCQTLDYRPATSISTMRYGLSSGPIVKCLDEDFRVESSQCQVISDADSSPLCSRDTVVDVVCSGTERGYQGKIRLLNGTEPTEGRIEVFHDNIWWRVCADNWSLEKAKTGCYQLGMPTPTELLKGGVFGVNNERAFLPKKLNCSGEERKLVDCLSTEPNDTPCETGDAGLQCGIWKDAKEGDVRLIGTRVASIGRIEIYNGTQWEILCSESWNNQKEHVTCRQMGYLTGNSEYIVERFSRTRTSSYWEDNRRCSGTENSLLECGVSDAPVRYCSYTNDVRSGCDTRPRVDSLQVRLTNGPHPNQGIVEVEYNGQWGTICDEGWDDIDAQVICRQLGFGDVFLTLDRYDTKELYESSEGVVLFYNVGCHGSEKNLSDCYYGVPRYSRCFNDDAVSVICESEEYPSIDPRIRIVPPEDEGLESYQIRNIIMGVLFGISVICSLCWLCLKWLAKRETSTPVSGASGGTNQYQSVKDLPPKHDEENLPVESSQTAV